MKMWAAFKRGPIIKLKITCIYLKQIKGMSLANGPNYEPCWDHIRR